jgi:hypothetical protein
MLYYYTADTMTMTTTVYLKRLIVENSARGGLGAFRKGYLATTTTTTMTVVGVYRGRRGHRTSYIYISYHRVCTLHTYI